MLWREQHVNASLDQTGERRWNSSIMWRAQVHSNSCWSFVAFRCSAPSRKKVEVEELSQTCRASSPCWIDLLCRASRFNDEHCRCSRLCGSRVNCLEPCRRGSILVNRTSCDHAQRARWWGSMSLNSKAESLQGLRRSQRGESGTVRTDESQRNLLGVVGPVATQDRCTSCWCRTHQTRTRSRRWFVHLVVRLPRLQ